MKMVFVVGLFAVLGTAAFAQTVARTPNISGKMEVAQSYCGQCANARASCTAQCNGSGVCIQRCNDAYDACLEQNFCRSRR